MNRRLTGFPEVVWRGLVFPVFVGALLAFVGLGHGADATSPAAEYEAKAGFLANFARFVEWPAQVRTNLVKFRIGVVDDGKAFPVIAQVLTNRSIGLREIEIVRVKNGYDLKSFDIVFVTRSQAKRTKIVLEKIGTAPVLTVGEASGFAADGGCINFVLEGKCVRFEVNTGVAEQADLKISSRLASMATVVETREGTR